MNSFLAILIVAAAIGAVVMLVRGVVTFLRTSHEELHSGQAGPSASSLKQNKMMFARVGFQAVAVLLVAILLLLNGGNQ